MESDVEDQFRFPARTVPAGETVSKLPSGPTPEEVRISVDDLIHATGTRAFLVVHKDRLVVERVTGTTVSDFMATRLWQPLGAEADATWSIDSEASGFEKLESGVNARPRDFARFGLMMLHDGRWNGRRIVSQEWVREATAASTATDPAPFYQYFWWVGPEDPDGSASYFARGKYGPDDRRLPRRGRRHRPAGDHRGRRRLAGAAPGDRHPGRLCAVSGHPARRTLEG